MNVRVMKISMKVEQFLSSGMRSCKVNARHSCALLLHYVDKKTALSVKKSLILFKLDEFADVDKTKKY